MMKKLMLMAFAAMLMISAGAQYKKSNLFNRSGRLYDIGISKRFMGAERKSGPGFFIAFGKESDEKRLHSWFEVELITGNKYTYNTVASNDASVPVVVNGESGASISARYNLAFFLADNSSDDSKILPYLNIAAGYMTTGNALEETYSPNTFPAKVTSSTRAGFIYGGGGGIIYRLNPQLGIRLSATYFGITGGDKSPDIFQTAINHTVVNLGFRFKMLGED